MKQYLPFYMVYGGDDMRSGGIFSEQADREEEVRVRRDYEYMRSAYPDTAKRIMPVVEKMLDRMEYHGSMIYDEYPDQLQMRLISRRVYDEVAVEEKNPGKWLFDMIQVLTWQEIMKRRNEYRKYRRKFY